jgi:hypothetical protein
MKSRFNHNILYSAAMFFLATGPGVAQELAQTSTAAAALSKHQLPLVIADGASESNSQTMAQKDEISCLPGHHFAKALSFSGVELTDAQVERLTALRQDVIRSMISPVSHLVALVIDAKEALTSTDLNDEKVHSIFAQIKTEIDSSYSKCTDHILAVAHVFTSDQRQKMRIAIDRVGLGSLGKPHHDPSSSTPQHGSTPL